MTNPRHPSRLEELLLDRALDGLTAGETAELEALLREHPEADADAFDRVAAALAVALNDHPLEPLPKAVGDRLQHAARQFERSFVPARDDEPLPDEPAVAARIGARPSALPWILAAACILLALAAWWPALTGVTGRPSYEALLSEPDLIRVAWAPGPDETGAGASGEVLWSDSRQHGYMIFRGLPKLDPSVNQYQLWIVDPDRDTHPVDGGVFDINPAVAAPNGELRIPIDAKLAIERPAAFVITVEQPGGVVVSSQERVSLIAAVPSDGASSH